MSEEQEPDKYPNAKWLADKILDLAQARRVSFIEFGIAIFALAEMIRSKMPGLWEDLEATKNNDESDPNQMSFDLN